MRLTTISRMALPNGQVSRYEVQVTPTDGSALPLSFDQARHAGLGRRAGSWMALAFELPFPADRELIAQAWLAVIDRHGTLRTVISDDEGAASLRQVRIDSGHWRSVEAEPDEDARAVLGREFDTACDPFAAPSHLLCLVEPIDGSTPTVVLGLDHCHVDAWSLLVLLRDFTSCLDDLANALAPGCSLPEVPSFAAHTAELAARPPAPDAVHARWAQILAQGNGDMPVFPLPLGDVSTPQPEVVVVRDVLNAEELGGFEDQCRARGVRMIAAAMAEMTAVALSHGAESMRAVLPTHSRTGPVDDPARWHDSVGWFITNSVIECTSIDPVDCGRSVAEAVALGAHALAPILAPYGGMPHTPGMFAISWLDNRRLPVDVDLSLRPQHVSASIRTTGVMVWFVVNVDGLHLRCRYPDTPEARGSVGGWIDEVCAGLRRHVDSVALAECVAGPQ